MATAQWISILVTLVGAAVVWGQLRNQVGNIDTKLEELRRDFRDSSKDQGQRLGKLERVDEVRRATGAFRVPQRAPTPPPEET